ncbi:MAG: permease [Stappia sp.]|uniref:DUF6691 family protein n=1 Tax=Stappia sp. TaxID=1870903 RepID=UPI000C65BFFC|nr:DUF6691 family protein [Stappia sp.]MAA97332.1 permease [Stappia sp.]MBM18511.1 permease [Stappia sp.]
MTHPAVRLAAAFAIGLVFGTGILLAGMANPAKVLNFFDLAAIPGGGWDPSLAVVMAAALTVTAIGYRLVLSRPRPLLSGGFTLPSRHGIDARLVGGAAIFGIGWGITGFCPGGVVPALGLGRIEPFLFCLAVAAGMIATRRFVHARAMLARATARPAA